MYEGFIDAQEGLIGFKPTPMVIEKETVSKKQARDSDDDDEESYTKRRRSSTSSFSRKSIGHGKLIQDYASNGEEELAKLLNIAVHWLFEMSPEDPARKCKANHKTSGVYLNTKHYCKGTSNQVRKVGRP